MANAFAAYLAEHHHDLDAYLDSFFTEQTQHADLERYLYAPLAAFSANGGKRHRPLICMLAARAVGGDPARARSAAAAIEHFQSAALIHDDIADKGQLRRGKPCMYLTEGVGRAINCGDYDITLSTDAVLRDEALDAPLKLRVLGELTAMMQRTVEGQALDLGWVQNERFDLTVQDYLTMATLKTAHYSGAVPLAVGAMVGGGSEQQVEALRSFGLATGLAFQIQDDLLNLVGDAGDKVHALEHAESETRRELVEILRSGTQDAALLERAVEIFDETGSIAFAHDYALRLTERAKEELSGIELENDCRKLLLSMADFFVERLS